jgi:hypothetical protein
LRNGRCHSESLELIAWMLGWLLETARKRAERKSNQFYRVCIRDAENHNAFLSTNPTGK